MAMGNPRGAGILLTLVFAGMFASLPVSGQTAAGAESAVVRIPGKYRSRYLLRFRLSSNNISLRSGAPGERKALEFSEGGQFEVLIPKQKFPIPAPNCRGNLILRMPWTDPSGVHAPEEIERKRALYTQVQNLERNPLASLEAVLELGPYVRVINESPLRLQLTTCNIFFRQDGGVYIDKIR